MPRHATFAALALLLLQACVTTGGEREPTAEEKKRLVEIHTESAQQYLNMGELDRAEGQVEKGLALEKDNRKLQQILGKTLLKRGRAEDLMRAEKVFRAGDPADYEISIGLGATLERLAVLHRESAKDIRSGKHLTQAPDPEQRAKDFEQRADTYLGEARGCFERSLQLKPDNVDGMNGLVRVEALLGNDDASIANAEKLVTLLRADRKFWETSLVRPEISADEENRFRKLARAQAELEVALHLHVAGLLHKHQRDEQAVAHLDSVIELKPELAEAYSRRAENRMLLGQYEMAEADLDTFLRLSADKTSNDPDIMRAYQLRSDCMRKAREAGGR
jgi:tetratricopeptide (TPR) repeat protein